MISNHLASPELEGEIPGISSWPCAARMQQIGRQLIDGWGGFLSGKRYLIMDRDPLQIAASGASLAPIESWHRKSARTPQASSWTRSAVVQPARWGLRCRAWARRGRRDRRRCTSSML